MGGGGVKIIDFFMTLYFDDLWHSLLNKNGNIYVLCRVCFFFQIFRNCHGHFFKVFTGNFLFSQNCNGDFFFVPGNFLPFLSRALKKLSRAFFEVKIVTGILTVFCPDFEKISRALEKVSRGKK